MKTKTDRSGFRWARRVRGLTAAVAVAALALRLLYIFRWEGGALASQTPAGDAAQYVEIARSLVTGEGFRMDNGFRSYRPPLFPLFLTPFYRFVSEPVPAILFVHGLLGAATCVLALGLAARLAGTAAGLAVGVACALSFELLSANGRILSETLFTFLLTGAMLALLCWRRRPVGWVALGAGLLMGLAVLTRSMVVLLPLGLAAWMPVAHPPVQRAFRRRARWHALFFLCAAVFVVAPWLLRNMQLHGAFMLTTDMGKILYGSFAPSATGGTDGYYEIGRDFVIPVGLGVGTEAEINRQLTRAALAELADDPWRVAALIPRKLANMWRPWPVGADWRATVAVALFLLPTLGLVCLGSGLFLTRWRRYAPVLLACIYVTGLHALLMSEPRYRYPIMPLLTVLAVSAAVCLYGRLPARARPFCMSARRYRRVGQEGTYNAPGSPAAPCTR